MAQRKKRGRPRKDPAKLAQWSPPKGWVRVVAWVSPEERKALKRTAIEADASVAKLIRGLASGLAHGVVSSEELLSQFRKGVPVMEKIPTLFDRGDNFKVTDKVRTGCEWVFADEGVATEKLDGTNIRITIRGGQLVRIEKRKNPTKLQKKQGIIDGWYVDADEHASQDRWIVEAARNTDVTQWPDGEHPCEALGPKIQGNPLGLEQQICVPFNLEIPTFEEIDRSFDGLKQFLEQVDSHYAPGNRAEGIVFHHPDGRRAKIKRKDFAY